MEIVDYETYRLPPRWLVTKLETDGGAIGWGEHVVGAGGPDPVEAAATTLAERYLLGADPTRIRDHWERMYRGGFYRGGPVLMSAIAGLDIALWDLTARQHGAAIHELLGGRVRDRMRVYQWIGGDDPGDLAAETERALDAGFTAFKMNATGPFERLETPAAVEAAGERLRTVREVAGESARIAVDFHGRVATPMAERLIEELEAFDPLFVEEPVLPENLDNLPEIAGHTSVPIAAGERLFSRWEFKRLFTAGGVDVAQPDLCHAGGITEASRIASMAEAFDVALAPHCPLGPVALAACLQIDAVSPNAVIQEQSLNIHYNETADLRAYLDDPSVFEYDDGFVAIPDGPGLGITLDADAVAEAAVDDPGAEWEPPVGLYKPVWRHDDGGVAEW